MEMCVHKFFLSFFSQLYYLSHTHLFYEGSSLNFFPKIFTLKTPFLSSRLRYPSSSCALLTFKTLFNLFICRNVLELNLSLIFIFSLSSKLRESSLLSNFSSYFTINCTAFTRSVSRGFLS